MTEKAYQQLCARAGISPLASSGARTRTEPEKPKSVEGPLEWTVTVHGHVPSKKNLWERRGPGVMVLPAEVKDQIATLIAQIFFLWRFGAPVEHPEITVKFYVRAARQDQDGQYTTILDCLQAAGVLVNDNWAHNNGRKVLEPAEFVKPEHERVEITIRKGV